VATKDFNGLEELLTVKLFMQQLYQGKKIPSI